jgi:sulfonate transport system substrate-binding protein
MPLSHSSFKSISRRAALKGAGAVGLAVALTGVSPRAVLADNKTLRIGFQKYGTLILLKGKGTLEKALEPLGVTVTWTEFPAGPQLLEGLNVGAIDFGSTGEAPPIFAQAAGAPLVYVGHEPPAPKGEAILVPKDSPIQTVADLKGKKVAFNKGSNVHYLLVKALEKAGLAYADIEPAFLPPADARAAFEKGAVDAWVIWDPFQASAEQATGARSLSNGEGLVSNHQFYLSTKEYSGANGEVLNVLIKQIEELDSWANGNTDKVAEELSASVGIPAEILKVALARQTYGVQAISDAVIAEQQKIADVFFELKLIPKAIKVSEAVWKPSA